MNLNVCKSHIIVQSGQLINQQRWGRFLREEIPLNCHPDLDGQDSHDRDEVDGAVGLAAGKVVAPALPLQLDARPHLGLRHRHHAVRALREQRLPRIHPPAFLARITLVLCDASQEAAFFDGIFSSKYDLDGVVNRSKQIGQKMVVLESPRGVEIFVHPFRAMFRSAGTS